MISTKNESNHFVHELLFPMGQDRELITTEQGRFSCFDDVRIRRVRIEGNFHNGWFEQPLKGPMGVGSALGEIQSDSFSKAAQHMMCDELNIPHNNEWGAFSVPIRDVRTGARKSILRLLPPKSGYLEAFEYLQEGILMGQQTSLDNPTGGTVSYRNASGRHLLNNRECTIEEAIKAMKDTLDTIESSSLVTFKMNGYPDLKRIRIDSVTALQIIEGITPNEHGLVDFFIKPSRGTARGDSVSRITIDSLKQTVRIAANDRDPISVIFNPDNVKGSCGPYVQSFELKRAAALVAHMLNCTEEPIIERAIPGVRLRTGESVEFRVIVVRPGQTECIKLSDSEYSADAIGAYTKLSNSPVGNNIATGGKASKVEAIVDLALKENFPFLTKAERTARIETFMRDIFDYSERMGAALFEYHDSLAEGLATQTNSVADFQAPFLHSMDFIPVIDQERKTITPVFLELGYFPKYEGLREIDPVTAGKLDEYQERWKRVGVPKRGANEPVF